MDRGSGVCSLGEDNLEQVVDCSASLSLRITPCLYILQLLVAMVPHETYYNYFLGLKYSKVYIQCIVPLGVCPMCV